MRRRAIELRIEKLVLEGFGKGDGERIRASLERELTRLLAEPGVSEGLTQNRVIGRLQGEQIRTKPGANAAPSGKQIAWAIYGAIKR